MFISLSCEIHFMFTSCSYHIQIRFTSCYFSLSRLFSVFPLRGLATTEVWSIAMCRAGLFDSTRIESIGLGIHLDSLVLDLRPIETWIKHFFFKVSHLVTFCHFVSFLFMASECSHEVAQRHWDFGRTLVIVMIVIWSLDFLDSRNSVARWVEPGATMCRNADGNHGNRNMPIWFDMDGFGLFKTFFTCQKIHKVSHQRFFSIFVFLF